MPYILSHRMQQRLAVAGPMTCLVALSAELTVHMAGHMARGGTVVGALLSYVSYYTVGSNMLLVAVYAAHLSRARALRILRDTRVRTAAMITLVMLVYLFILSRVEASQGLGKVSAVLAHYVAPPLYIAWWTATSHRDRIGFRDLPYMVAPSIAYMIYVLLLGHLTGRYPLRHAGCGSAQHFGHGPSRNGPAVGPVSGFLSFYRAWALAVREGRTTPSWQAVRLSAVTFASLFRPTCWDMCKRLTLHQCVLGAAVQNRIDWVARLAVAPLQQRPMKGDGNAEMGSN